MTTTSLTDNELISLYRNMRTIREVELRLSRDFKSGKLPGPVHLYIGQEAVAAGVCINLTSRDWITSTHRGHGHFLAKGGALDSFFYEIFGRAEGVCGGKGGSMHVADVSKGILGANGIVGAGIGLATGAALAAQLQGENNVAVAFFGDGAANQGVLAEALNIASLWKLPLIFVCENNQFSEFSHSKDVTAGRIHRRAEAFDVPAEEVDGNNVIQVQQAAARAVTRARQGAGPTFIEAMTYRLHGHTESEKNFLAKAYRSEEEIDAWRLRDPIDKFMSILLEKDEFSKEVLEKLSEDVVKAVEDAANAAGQAPWPEEDEAFENMSA